MSEAFQGVHHSNWWFVGSTVMRKIDESNPSFRCRRLRVGRIK
jgi:hypothetical protein